MNRPAFSHSTARYPLRSAVFAVAVSISALFASAAPAAYAQAIRGHADASAEAFIQQQANKIIGVLNDPSMSIATKKQAFRQEIDQVADVPRISRFVLGKYARSVQPSQFSQFTAAFREYGYGVYESRLNDYKGQRFTVTGSVQRSPGDVVVASTVGSATSPVLWRLIGNGGDWKVVDVQVAGVWLAITEQQDFVSTLDNAGGDINVLIRQLRTNTGRAG